MAKMQVVDQSAAARLLYPRLTVLVTSISREGKVNAAPYSWVAPVSFSPPMLYLGIQRKETQTVKNIRETKEFVVNVVTREWAQQAVNCESKQPDKVERSGVKLRESKKVKAPTAEQAKIALECKLAEILEVEEADHYLVIGKIVHAEKDEAMKDSEIAMHLSGSRFVNPGEEFEVRRKK